MDILYTIIKTGGYIISLGILAIVPALFIAALLTRLPWIIAAPAMAFVAFIAAYPAGMLEGISSERAAWEIEIHNLRSAMNVKKHQADKAVSIVEAKYLHAETGRIEMRQQLDDSLLNLINSEGDIDAQSKCPICLPYTMRADASIVRNIQER